MKNLFTIMSIFCALFLIIDICAGLYFWAIWMAVLLAYNMYNRSTWDKRVNALIELKKLNEESLQKYKLDALYGRDKHEP